MVTSTAQDPSLEKAPIYSYFNDTFDRVDGMVQLPSAVFNNILHALEGIETISCLLISNEVAKANPEEAPLAQHVVGGLESAARSLACFSIDAMERVITNHEKLHRGGRHE
jgi:hypothetical protein